MELVRFVSRGDGIAHHNFHNTPDLKSHIDNTSGTLSLKFIIGKIKNDQCPSCGSELKAINYKRRFFGCQKYRTTGCCTKIRAVHYKKFKQMGTRTRTRKITEFFPPRYK